MSHFILPTLNAFLYCVIFMVVTVSCGIVYALFKWFCSDEETTTTHPGNNRDYGEDDYRENGFTSIQQSRPHDDDPAPQYIPMNVYQAHDNPTPQYIPLNKGPTPRASPVPFAPYPSTTPYQSASSPLYPPSVQGSTLPYPTESSAGMPMPMPTPQYPTSSSSTDGPPSYQDAMIQPAYNPSYRPT